MANTQAVVNTFKVEILNGHHQFGSPTLVSRTSLTAPTKDSFKAALYLVSASRGAGDTVYNSTGEVSGTNYSAGGIAVTNATVPSLSTATAVWTPSASLVYGTGGSPLTLATAFDAVLIYNSTQGDKAVSVHTFGSQTITSGILTLTMPANAAGTAILNIA